MFYEKSGDGIGVGLHKVSSQTKHVSVNTEEISDEVAGDEGAETSCRTPITSARNTLPFIYVRKIAREWLLRDIRIEGMDKHPRILKMICGRVGDQSTIKVFLASVDEEIKDFVRKNVKCAAKDAKFDFVAVQLKKNRPKLKEMETKSNPVDQSTQKTLNFMTEEEEDKLFAKHSNIIAIGTSPVQQVDDEFIDSPCIVIYCLDKELVPFGEKRLPEELNGLPCVIREEFFQLGICRKNSHTLVHGCSIGIHNHEDSGSVGFLARENSNSNPGFLTAAHVALSSTILAQLNENRLTEIPNLSERGPFEITHPSKEDGHPHNVVIGEVTESYFGSFGEVGIDAAFVKFTNINEEELCTLREENWGEQEHFPYPIESKVVNLATVNNGVKVYKRGRTTGITKGIFTHKQSQRVDHSHIPGVSLILKKCLHIEHLNDGKEVFFEGGDSGSGVFVLVEDIDPTKARLKPLGILFGSYTDDTALACPLENVLSTLNVSIV